MRTSVEGDIHVRTRATTESAYLDRTHNDVCLDTGQAPPGTHNAPKVGHLVLEDPAFEWELPMEHVSERLHTADTLGSTHAERSPEHEKGRDDRDSELGYVQERREPRRSRAAAPVDPAHAAREQVKENSGREVQAHLLEVERSAKQHGPEHLVPASDCGDGMQRQTERDGIVLEVAVVDQDRGGCRERQHDATKHATLPRSGGILRGASPFRTLEDVRERKTGSEKHGDVEREHLSVRRR